MKEPLICIGRSQIRVSSRRSSEMKLHLNRVGTEPHCSRDQICAPESFLCSRSVIKRRNTTQDTRSPPLICWCQTGRGSSFWLHFRYMMEPQPGQMDRVKPLVKAFIRSTEYRQRFGR